MTVNLILLPWTAAAYDDDPNIGVFVDKPIPYQDWYEYDRAYVEDAVGMLSGDQEGMKMTFLKEWQELARETARVFDGAFHDPQGKFMVYSASATGKIYVLALARYYRERFIKHALQGSLPAEGYPDWLQGGLPAGIPSLSTAGFVQGDSLHPYTIAGTVKSIHDITIPGEPFQGVTFYLLPFRISGYEGAAYTMNTPGRDEAVYLSASVNPNPTRLAVLVDHELGHFIHYQYIGSYHKNPGDWERFMSLLGETRYNKSGVSAQKTDEKFAECFRLICGSSLGCQGRSFQEDLLDSSGGCAYRTLVEELISRGDPSYFDVNRIKVTITDYRGQFLSFPIGLRTEQINVIVTSTPEVLITAPLILNGKDEFVPVGACYYTNFKQEPVDYSYLNNEAELVNYKLTLPGEGIYTVYLGRKDGNGFTDALKFQIIYFDHQSE